MAFIEKRRRLTFKVCVNASEAKRIAALRAGAQEHSALRQLPQRLDCTFDNEAAATERVDFYRRVGIQGVTVKPRQSVSWQVRIRLAGAPNLTKTFPNKSMADDWAKEKEGEIVKRSFVDYREAERRSLADLLMRYDRDRRGTRPKDDPDRVRLRVLASQPIAAIRMNLLQKSDLCAYRDARLNGSVDVPAVKGSTVKKELELICRVIGLAIREWGIHLPFNPASAQHVARPAAAPGDQRDRRLELAFVPLDGIAAREERRGSTTTRRVHGDDDFERDPELDALLAMPWSEQKALLTASRYPHWFKQTKKSTNAATLRRRAAKKQQAPHESTRVQ
ncbi:MAG: hypothetical protein DI587_33260 [Variovorax paradoxus]|nr:MAG: hypothetical protein DI583_33260 [Variovorax paradoxus]PZQ02159.1 MAG: hypothetical protein DI587_33260 [Variovorax paradoxus]